MRLSILLALIPFLAPLAPAQEKTETGYRVVYTLRDGADAKAGRHYSLLVDAGGRCSFRSGTRVPVASGKDQPNYIDLGVNIDCQLRLENGRITLGSEIEVSSLPRTDGLALPPPAISQARIKVNSTLQSGRRAVIASLDDPTFQRRFDVEALVTKVD